MSAQKASTPVRFARLAAVAVLIGLTVLLISRLAGRRETPPAAPAAPPPEGQVVDLKEKVRHQEYREGRAVADIRGESFFRGPDGRNHLAGSVEVLSLGSAGETVSRLTADEVAYDPGSLRFTISGHVRVEAGGVVLEGETFDYDKSMGLFETKTDGRFSSKTMRGSAPDISFSEGADEIRLGGGFLAAIAAAGQAGETLDISGDSFSFLRRERRGRVEGRAGLRAGGCRGTSDTVSFVATGDEAAFESAVFEGAARLVFGEGAPGGRGTGEVRADRIAVAFARAPFAILSVEAASAVSLSVRSASGERSLVTAPAAALRFGPDGELQTWSMSGGVRARLSDADAPGRTLEGDAAWFDAATGSLRVQGAPGRPSFADSPEARVEAASIMAGPGSGDIEAWGGVVCLLKPVEGRRALGFFASGEPVSATSDTLALRGGASSASFAGNVRIWQGAESILARELEFSEDKGEMRGRGGVAAVVEQSVADDAAGKRIELGGQDLTFQSAARTLTLTTKAYVQLATARLEAGAVSAVLGGDAGDVESLEAKTAVAVSKGRYQGRSDTASYRAATRRITLTGKPVLTDGKGGSARGAKLTFDLADDKILIENEGTGRATTVVRS
jgi:lipopolysaccharide export system protein LptA